jgi:O-antigen/teichoic acid export membrane protein
VNYGPSLKRGAAWTFLGTTIAMAAQGGIMMALAKLGTPEIVGQYALAVAMVGPVILLTNLNLRAVQATDARHDHPFVSYLGLRLCGLALAGVACLAFGLISGLGAASLAALMLVYAARAFDGVSDVIAGLLQNHERLDLMSRSRALQSVCQFIVLVSVFWLTGSLLWALAAAALSVAATTFTYDASCAREVLSDEDGGKIGLVPALERGFAAWSGPDVRRLLWTSLPLGIVAGLDSLSVNVPRYIVEHFEGKEGLAFFAAAAYVMFLGAAAIDAMAAPARPRLAKLFLHDLPAFRWLVIRIAFLAGLCGFAAWLVCWLWGAQLLTLLYTPEYARHADVLSWLMVAAAIWYVAGIFSTAVTATRSFRIQVPILLGVVLVTGVASFLLVPKFGLRGAGWSVVAGMAARLLGIGVAFTQVMRARGRRDSR